MNPILEKLLEIQNLADEIHKLKQNCEQIPLMMDKLDRHLETAQSKRDALRAFIKENESQIRKAEGLILDARNQQGKYRTQLFKLKSNREYQALNNEINTLNDKISQLETDIIERMESIDSAQVERHEADIQLKEESVRIEKEKAGLARDLHEQKRRLVDAEKAYIEKRDSLPDETIGEFDRLVRKNGRAVSELNNKTCGNCFVKVRPQIAASVAGNQHLLNCDKCGVYLYSSDTFQS